MLYEESQFLEALYIECFPKLLLYAETVLRDTDRAQDVVQDTFHEAIRHIDTLIKHKNPGGWLMETLKNKIRDSERARRRCISRFISLDSDILEHIIPSNQSLDDQVEQDDTSVCQAIENALTPDESKLLKRLAFDKASHLEVAKEFGITVYASEKRFQRIKEKLYKLFPERKMHKKKIK